MDHGLLDIDFRLFLEYGKLFIPTRVGRVFGEEPAHICIIDTAFPFNIPSHYIELEPDQVASKIRQYQLPFHWMIVHTNEPDIIINLIGRIKSVLLPQTFLCTELQLDDEDTGGLL
jgi:hypothetical protein